MKANTTGKGMSVEVEGLDKLKSKLAGIPKKAVKNVLSEFTDILLDLQGKAQAICPHDLGDLEGSANSGAKAVGTSVTGFVSFDTPYATRQHEELEWQHEPGRQAKYLETPLKENLDNYIEQIEDAIKKGVI
jgi:hypothetical protein